MTFDRREANAAAIGFLQLAALVCAAAALLATCARAAGINESGMEVPTQAQILACGWDARRFCWEFLNPNLAAMSAEGRAILHVCMQAHERQLSPRCKEAFK